jgi:hypothetical protein
MKIIAFSICHLLLISCNSISKKPESIISVGVDAAKKDTFFQSIMERTYDHYREKRTFGDNDTLVLYNHKTDFLRQQFGCDTCQFIARKEFSSKWIGGQTIIKPLFIHNSKFIYYSIATYYVNAKEGFNKGEIWGWNEYPVDKAAEYLSPGWPDGKCLSQADIVFRIK